MKNSAHVCLFMPLVCLCAVVCLLRGQTQEPTNAVASGLMTAELHPFNVVLQRKNP
jgi:hypothetical protein